MVAFPKVVYFGTKLSESHNCDVYIINHPEHRCLEVVADCSIEDRLTRLYLNSDFLVAKINTEVFNEALNIKIKSIRSSVSNLPQIMTDVATSMVVAMIVGRLRVADAKKSHCVYLQPTATDRQVLDKDSVYRLDFEYLEMPLRLVPFDYLRWKEANGGRKRAFSECSAETSTTSLESRSLAPSDNSGVSDEVQTFYTSYSEVSLPEYVAVKPCPSKFRFWSSISKSFVSIFASSSNSKSGKVVPVPSN